MIRKCLGGALLLLAIVAGAASAVDRTEIEAADGSLDGEIRTAPVVIDGHVLFSVRGATSFPAPARAAAIAERIERFARDPALDLASVRAVDEEGYSAIMLGERRVMALFDSDARVEQLGRQTLGIAYSARISRAIDDYRRERSADYLRQRGIESVAATLLLLVAAVLAILLTRRLDPLLERFFGRRIRNLGIQSFEIVRAESVWIVLRAMLSTLRVLLVLAAVFAYLDFVLSRFPWTRGFAKGLGDLVLSPLKVVGEGVVGYLPNLVFLIILALLVRFLLRLIRLFFDAVARGTVAFASFDADWAWPTYKITRFAVLALAVIVAYPYIPGSDSAAFKGVSLFLGVIVSLGSSSAIANIIAGLMITYRRAFKVGDRVKIGEIVGDVTDVRLQVTHLRTLKNEEVTIPNSTILNGHVVNFSSLAKRHGLIVYTTVGIGYETPWRQVEAMLLIAAEKTAGVLAEPRPFVLHKGLGDFCVSYEINVYCHEAKHIEDVRSELQRNILDVFNEYGVQIMTPAYERDTDTPKVVPKEQWYLAPAAPERPANPEGEAPPQ